jgi:hypothetical protein
VRGTKSRDQVEREDAGTPSLCCHRDRGSRNQQDNRYSDDVLAALYLRGDSLFRGQEVTRPG